MEITPSTLGLVVTCASLVVIGLAIHYVMRVGRRYDMLCFNGLLAAALGLQAAAFGLRAAPEPMASGDLFSASALGFASFCIALAVWREGLRRFRDNG